jgi:LuxR family maltose regulon positive regulatory protein
MLERSNLFIIPLDEERLWYRYHHLFADLLYQRLQQTQPDQLDVLHHRASEWYEENGFADEAIEHALRAEDYERVVRMVDKHADAIWQRGEHTRFRRWLTEIPIQLVFSQPHLCIINAWDLFMNGQREKAEQNLQAAENVLEISIGLATENAQIELGKMHDIDRMKIQGRAATIRAYLTLYQGDLKESKKYVSKALEYLPKQDLIWRSTATVVLGDAYGTSGDLSSAYQVRLEALEVSKTAGNNYWTLIASTKLAMNMRWLGQLEQVIEICQKQLERAIESGLSHTVVVGWLLAIWGETLAELNDLDGAILQAKKGTELVESGRELGTLGLSYHCLMRVLFSRGDIAGVEEVIRKMVNIGREYHLPPWISNRMAAWQGRIWLAYDNLDAASQWVDERGLDVNGKFTFQQEREYIVLARILITQDRQDEATRLLQRLLEAAKTSGHTSRTIEILILQALSLQAQGDDNKAMIRLKRALTHAKSGGYIRIFVDEGPPMEALLKKVKVEDKNLQEYVRKLLAAFSDKDSRPSSLSPQSLIEPLSEREIDVLQLVAEGLTNQEIASRLYLSLNTIKVHTRNIYSKLGVNNRTQAAARAKDLKILPPTD